MDFESTPASLVKSTLSVVKWGMSLNRWMGSIMMRGMVSKLCLAQAADRHGPAEDYDRRSINIISAFSPFTVAWSCQPQPLPNLPGFCYRSTIRIGQAR